MNFYIQSTESGNPYLQIQRNQSGGRRLLLSVGGGGPFDGFIPRWIEGLIPSSVEGLRAALSGCEEDDLDQVAGSNQIQVKPGLK